LNEDDNKLYEVQEMYYGFRDKFNYFQCNQCKCLQILAIPSGMSKYYPENYYSFNAIEERNNYLNFIIDPIKKRRNKYALLNQGGFWGNLIYRFFPNEIIGSMNYCQLTNESRILDVGCGTGKLLYACADAGLKQLLGIDPYLKRDIVYDNGLLILRRFIYDLSGQWDLIMFHHSFEHISDPIETLCKVSKLLAPGGICLIRIPVVSSYAWEYYRENWYQLDAPRHFYLHSIESMEIIAKKTMLKLEKVIFDSCYLQFCISELYKRNIPHVEQTNKHFKKIFSKNDMRRYRRETRKLNLQNYGDQAAFYLRKE